jgi:hypothetical protein
MGVELHFMAFGMDLPCYRPHRVMLEMVALLGLDEEGCLNFIFAEGVEHEAQALGTAFDIAPYHGLGDGLLRLVRKRATDAEFGVDRNADMGACYRCILHMN